MGVLFFIYEQLSQFVREQDEQEEPEPTELLNLLPEENPKVEKSFSKSSEPHFSHTIFSDLLIISFSNFSPHFLHLYSKTGIFHLLSKNIF